MKSVDERTQEIIEAVENEMRFDSIPVKDVLHAFLPLVRIAAAASNYVECRRSMTESESRGSSALKEHQQILIQEVIKAKKDA